MRELCVCLFKAEGIFDSYGSTVSTGTEQQKQIHAWMHACILLVICIALRSTFLQPCFHNATLGFAQMPTTRQTLRNKWCLCTAEDVITEEWRNFVIEAAETYGAEIGKYLRVKPVQDTHLQMVRQMVCLGEILIGVLTVQTSMRHSRRPSFTEGTRVWSWMVLKTRSYPFSMS